MRNTTVAELGTLFADQMASLGPFEPSPRIAVAVSGGADSLALALLARDWVRGRGGSLLALVVDHGLRPYSGAEAARAMARLSAQGIEARVLKVTNLQRGSALAARARFARYQELQNACAEAGILHLLLGHHAADQAETVLIRGLAGSGPQGLAGMAALFETPSLRLLRPLLHAPPAWLRDLLRAAAVDWTEDPSNIDTTALRPRLRLLRRDSAGWGLATRVLGAAAALFAAARAEQDKQIGVVLSKRARLYSEGFAVLLPGALPAPALAALLRMIGGAAFSSPPAAVEDLAAAPGPATLGGVRVLDAGRLGPGLLVVREPAAMAAPVEAHQDILWDGRFRLNGWGGLQCGTTLGALGEDATAVRSHTALPSIVLKTLPALRCGGALVAVPHICYPNALACDPQSLMFAPASGAAPAPFVGSAGFGHRLAGEIRAIG